jgi:hypothetical protein
MLAWFGNVVRRNGATAEQAVAESATLRLRGCDYAITISETTKVGSTVSRS